jgi:uncharacterized protein (DUF1684 family)
MKRTGFLIGLSLLFLQAHAQFDKTAELKKSEEFQQELNAEFADPQECPLTEADREHFEGLDFFPLNPDFCFEADFLRTPHEAPFMLKRTKDEVKYVKYGEVYFTYKGQEHMLNVYRNLKYYERGEYMDYLFLPFTDFTNGITTYGGGRYIDLTVPEGRTIVIDFNRAYNPLCAYNKKYSCPIVPRENDLPIAIEAGVKAFHH